MKCTLLVFQELTLAFKLRLQIASQSARDFALAAGDMSSIYSGNRREQLEEEMHICMNYLLT
jgi:hypothetical protein